MKCQGDPPEPPPEPRNDPVTIANQIIRRLVALAQSVVDLGKMAVVPCLPRRFRLHQVEAAKSLSLLLQAELLRIEARLIQEGVTETALMTAGADIELGQAVGLTPKGLAVPLDPKPHEPKPIQPKPIEPAWPPEQKDRYAGLRGPVKPRPEELN